MNKPEQIIGEQLRIIRYSLKLSQKNVASELETTSQSISNIEKGKFSSVTLRYLCLLRKMNIDINKLIDGNKIQELFQDNNISILEKTSDEPI